MTTVQPIINYDPQINTILSLPDQIILQIFDNIEDVADFIHFEITCKKTCALFVRLLPDSKRAEKIAGICSGSVVENNIMEKIVLTRSQNFKVPAEEMIPEYFRIVDGIVKLFCNDHWGKITKTEANIRRFLKSNVNDAFGRLAAQYLDPDPTNPKVSRVKEDLIIKLNAEKEKLLIKMNELPGTIHAAYLIMEAAQTEQNATEEAFLDAYREAYKDRKSVAELVTLNFTTVAVQTAKAKYVAASAAFESAKIKVEELSAELDKLSLWRGTVIIEGEFVEVMTKICHVDRGARSQATSLGNFFEMLNSNIPTGAEGEHYCIRQQILLEYFHSDHFA